MSDAETATEFAKRIRNEIIEECAMVAASTYVDEPSNPAFRSMRIATAKAIRALKTAQGTEK